MKTPRFYFAFLWLSIIIVIVFFFQLFISGYTDLFILNAKALHGEFWRFFTAIFLHGSAGHLLYNLFALVLFGFILEKTVGTRNFLLIFFTSGILANVISVFFYGSSLGASGAIYGVLGAVAILRPSMMVWVFGILMPMWLAAIVWVIGDLIGLFVPDSIGHIAHLSGMFFGILFGILIARTYKVRFVRRAPLHLHEPSVRAWENRYMRR